MIGSIPSDFSSDIAMALYKQWNLALACSKGDIVSHRTS